MLEKRIHVMYTNQKSKEGLGVKQNNTIIFGDSYSTFEGFIPAGYDVYYSEENRDGTGVTDVAQTWWHMLAREADLNLVLNDSWSGSTMGHTGYGNADCSKTSSFIFRLRQMIENGFFQKNEIHKVFVFGGTNDNCCGATLGEAKYENWVEDDLFFVLPAIAYFLQLLKKTCPRQKSTA